MAEYIMNEKSMPLIPLRGLWIYPHTVMHFDVGRAKSVKAIEIALEQDSKIFLTSQKDFKEVNPNEEDLYQVGVVANIKQTLKLPGGSLRVLVEGENRAKLNELETGEYLKAKIDEFVYKDEDATDEEINALIRLVKNDLKEFEKYNNQSNTEVLLSLGDIEDPGRFADTVASYVQFEMEEQMEILGELNIHIRLERLHEIFLKELELLKIQDKIDEEVKKQIDDSQKEYYLRERFRRCL